jgi:hypothetical protein
VSKHTQIKRRKSLKQKDATERECVTNGGLKGTKQRTKHYGNETKTRKKKITNKIITIIS